ncbi:hypothetical protein P153DRAFT_295253 [Dothidotthia symphoricarpi CBS 119687]|uniref:Uncharacterized protein n=1 Tax=Dothidotthia symphoricarpi CBS 119687 TaxID=1392245 RepID=A0A6A6AAD3_9PLEO|nr:uncharacterized protein P153DRAFT_295253 [Dothidotthia symphoricarpi CBS 119687]KAF2127641.1 hypothetical protein P153DRAFT_295253 [Dothidotthia symphoricarpi CBS 119687]
MSYASVAASGPKQSPEEVLARAPAPLEVEHTEDSVSSLVDVDSPHISSVPSDYEEQSVKTDTQEERIEREEEIKQTAKDIKQKAAARKEATKEKAEAAKEKAESAKEKVKKNSDNPVVVSNAVGLAVIGTLLSIGAYRKHSRGELTGKVVAAWAGVLGLFGVGDYFVSQYFFKRYPPKN